MLNLTMPKKAAGKRGPKPKPPEQVRSALVNFMVTAEERDRLAKAAELRGKTVADFIRDTMLPLADRIIATAGE